MSILAENRIEPYLEQFSRFIKAKHRETIVWTRHSRKKFQFTWESNFFNPRVPFLSQCKYRIDFIHKYADIYDYTCYMIIGSNSYDVQVVEINPMFDKYGEIGPEKESLRESSLILAQGIQEYVTTHDYTLANRLNKLSAKILRLLR